MFMVMGATFSNDWSTFTTFRSLQGLFGTVPQVIGLPIIHDMYTSAGKSVSLGLDRGRDAEVTTEWPRMINIW